MAEPGLSPRAEPAPLPDALIDPRRHVSEALLRELVDALLAEDVFGLRERSEVGVTLPPGVRVAGFSLREGERYLRLPLRAGERQLLMRVWPQSFFQPYRLSRPPVLAETGEELEPVALMRELVEALPLAERERARRGLGPLLSALEDAAARGVVAFAAEEALRRPFESGRTAGLVDWERLAALRDRPFHPLARAKEGWSPEDARSYGPEAGRSFGLDWVAVRRELLEQGVAGEDPATSVLEPAAQAQLAAAMDEAGLSAEQYVALPVHPWQHANSLVSLYSGEFASRDCVLVARGLGRFTATSSLRTLAPAQGFGAHLKLPLGIESLGALRTLPPRYLRNGDQASRLLALLRDRDPVLARHLHLCDEQRWWAFRDPSGDVFADKPAHLACQLREFPAALTSEPGCRLVPMAALAAMTADGRAPGLELLLRERAGEGGAYALFEELCTVLVEVSLRCFRMGVMPELHGQNVLLVMRSGRVSGLLLRDHDTLRTHAPWLEAHGLSAPAYVLKPNTPNTLMLDTPEELLGYFQTLAVQVNLYAIADVLSRSHGLALEASWSVLRDRISECLQRLDGPTPVREVLSRRLLEATEWPFKCILLPLLSREGPAGTGMPSSMSTTRSPFASLRLAPGRAGDAR